jgi:hypothetical protein
MNAPASWLKKAIFLSAITIEIRLGKAKIILPGEIADGEGGQYPALHVQRPVKFVGHLDDGDRHDDPVGGIYKIGQRAQGHQPETFRQDVEANHVEGADWKRPEGRLRSRRRLEMASIHGQRLNALGHLTVSAGTPPGTW